MKTINSESCSLIIVTFNSSHCIKSLAQAISKFKNIIFVDNASTDDTCQMIGDILPHAKLIKNSVNLGFGAANNIALAETLAPYTLLLNPDCLPKSDAIQNLLSAAEKFPDAAMYAPQLIGRDGNPELNYRWPSRNWKSSGPKAESSCCVGFICGAAILLNMKVMKEIGFFDETFFLYYEDEDLCQRVFNKKKEIILIPNVEFTHFSRGSVKGSNPLKSEFIRGFHHAQSKIIFEAKHIGLDQANKLRFKTLFLAILTLPIRLLLPQPRYIARLIGRIIGLCKLYQRPTLPIK
jgi:N-acetylglucosaminyl-diphospho-decaprenol L-rhamnosyltransferase